MHPQLEELVSEFGAASSQLDVLTRFPDPHWTRRPRPGSWSAAECIAHLNLASEAYLPRLDEGLSAARQRGGAAPTRYRRDPFGWLLSLTVGPAGRVRMRTSSAFVPPPDEDPAALRARFDELQEELLVRLRRADGLPLQAVRIPSPFDARARYNVYSAFLICVRHQFRHLAQAERALEAVTAGSRSR